MSAWSVSFGLGFPPRFEYVASMISLYDELIAKLNRDPRRTKRGGPRFDLGLLLFNARESIHELWAAADAEISRSRDAGTEPPARLEAAVERLRPLFGERRSA